MPEILILILILILIRRQQAEADKGLVGALETSKPTPVTDLL